VVSYLTSRPSRDLIVAGHQQITQDWWEIHRERFEAVASRLVAQEASTDDPVAAQQRLDILAKLELLEVTEESLALAKSMIADSILPSRAANDALHVAIAVTSGVEYLLTWNCRHLANATLRRSVERYCRSRGYEPVVICTPAELLKE